jgi:hypothetical protein
MSPPRFLMLIFGLLSHESLLISSSSFRFEFGAIQEYACLNEYTVR